MRCGRKVRRNKLKKYKKIIISCAFMLSAMSMNTFAEGIGGEMSVAGASVNVDGCMKDNKLFKLAIKFLRPDLYEELFEPETTAHGEPETKNTDVAYTEPETESESETLPEAPVEDEVFYILSIAPNYVNVRTTPDDSTRANIVGKMFNGAVGAVDSTFTGADGRVWYHVTSGTVSGYVCAEFFQVVSESEMAAAAGGTLIGVVNNNAKNLYVRSGPSVETTPYALISRGTQVSIVGEEGDFYQIQLDEACIGYVHKNYIDVSKKYMTAISLTEERVAAEAAAEESRSMAEAEAAAASAAQAEAESIAAAQAAAAAEEFARRQSIAAEVAAEASRQAAEAAAAEAARQAAEASRKAAEAAAASQATQPTQPTQPVITVVGVSAAYTGGVKYVGQTVSGAEMSVIGSFSDGTSYAVDYWNCDQVGKPLVEGDNVFTVEYKGFYTTFVVNARVKETQPTAPPETKPQTSDLRANIVAYALQFLGNPYVYGGSNLVTGTDCSGFTMRVYEAFGMAITRTSRSQAAAGREIAVTDVQPGDLLFYTDINTGIIGHVALYIGNGQIIHAATPALGIIISDMYYRMPCKAVTFL